VEKEQARKVLWIDDDIQKLGSYVAALRKRGYDVATAANAKESHLVLADHCPQVVLADIQMPDASGIEIIRQMHEDHPDLVYAVLSSFLYLQKYRDELGALGFPVQLIDKELPNVQDESFEQRFVSPIAALFDQGITYTIENAGQARQKMEGTDPFAISYADFMALPIVEKDKLADKAEQLAKDVIQNAFKRGKTWVLLCGNRREIADSSDDPQKIPTEEKILRYAQRKNRAPYQFCQSFINETYWTECATDFSLKDYPTVSLQFDGHDMESHFDTGCPHSLFSYEELVAMGVIAGATHFIKERRAGVADAYRCVVVRNLTAILKSQKSGQTLKVSLNGRAVREWTSTTYARFCDDKCKRHPDRLKGGLCPLRRALIGRNLLTDNRLSLTLDGAAMKTSFEGE
jgi:CheY-like chemotaxis protein